MTTGIIRIIDELGRIFIPKIVRKELSIKADEPLEISVEDGKIVLRKYVQE